MFQKAIFRAILTVPILLLAGSAAADSVAPWKPDGTSGGLWVESREVQGSSFHEIRITAVSSLGLVRMCDAIFGKGREAQSTVRFKKREILRETDTERWTYEQIEVPWVADRDYVMHTKLEQPASSGRCEVSFETQNDSSRPPVAGFVRIPCIRGHWWVAPTADGKLWLRYEVYSEPGGGIPAFLARGGQRSSAIEFVKAAIGRAGAPEVVARGTGP